MRQCLDIILLAILVSAASNDNELERYYAKKIIFNGNGHAVAYGNKVFHQPCPVNELPLRDTAYDEDDTTHHDDGSSVILSHAKGHSINVAQLPLEQQDAPMSLGSSSLHSSPDPWVRKHADEYVKPAAPAITSDPFDTTDDDEIPEKGEHVLVDIKKHHVEKQHVEKDHVDKDDPKKDHVDDPKKVKNPPDTGLKKVKHHHHHRHHHHYHHHHHRHHQKIEDEADGKPQPEKADSDKSENSEQSEPGKKRKLENNRPPHSDLPPKKKHGEPSFLQVTAVNNDLQAVINKFAKYCLHEIPNTEWLHCIKDPKTSGWKASHGSFGVALFAEIVGSEASNIVIRINGMLKPNAEGPRDLMWGPKSTLVLKPNVRLPTIIKAVFKNDRVPSTELRGQKISSLDAEVLGNRFASSRKFAGTDISITPRIYDIFYVNGNILQWHPIQDDGFLQEQLVGNTAYGLFKELLANEQQSIIDNLDRVIARFMAYLSYFKDTRSIVQRASNITAGGTRTGRIANGATSRGNAASSRANTALIPAASFLQLPKSKHNKALFEFYRGARRARQEFWARVRIRLRLAQLVTTAVQSMWGGGMMHCDSHFANIFLLSDVITTGKELIAAKKSGSVALPSFRFFLSDVGGITVDEQKNLNIGGIRCYPLDLNHIRWIDAANALPMDTLVKEQQQLMKIDQKKAEQNMRIPCPSHRLGMPDDISEILRGGLEHVLGLKMGSVQNKFQAALALVRSSAKHKDFFLMFDKYWKSKDIPNSEVWQIFFHFYEVYTSYINQADAMLNSLRMQFESMPSVKACREERERWAALASTKTTREILNIMENTPCNVAQMRQDVAAMHTLVASVTLTDK